MLTDLRALERMIAEGTLRDRRVAGFGAEQEIFLVDSWAPARAVLRMLDELADSHFTTELRSVPARGQRRPPAVRGRGHFAAREAARGARGEDAPHRGRAWTCARSSSGILPTIRKSDLGLDSMVPSPRYLAINKALHALRGGAFEFSIKGTEELIIKHDSVMLEACNSSFQVHLQVAPDEFARLYNLAQVLAAPVLAIATNSPLLFGRRLWAETRIALFRQAVDTRSHTHHLRESEARVSFGTRWVADSVVELYREDIARFRTVVGTALEEDPIALLDRGEIPMLKALRLHKGTSTGGTGPATA